MVFENTVSIVLNKFLGAYLENLDSTQLKIGFGGDLELKNLKLKQSALDDLNLPIKTVAGHVERLALKIPYTNLWNNPTTVHIKGVFLLAIPNQAVKYDEAKEKQAIKEAKQKQLSLIEEAKLRAQLIDNAQQDDGFIVKLCAQVIQNLLVTIEDVHIRYEDTVTNPSRPFACGITMKMLALQTTNSSWEPTQVGEASRLYYKLLSLEHLAVYWRSKASKQFCKMSPSELLENFIKGIACDNSRPYDDCYVAGPISLQAKMMFNSRPELDGSNFSIPKIFLKLTLEEISMGLSPDQYQDIIDCLNNMERMSRAAPYRKHRPLVFTNSRTRWRFAKECVLEEVVRRRRKNWNWSHMKEHRDKVKQYVTLYKKKLLSKKEEPLLKKSLEGYEDRLDVFNITLARRQAEVEVERVRQEQKKIEEAKAQEPRGWFSWLRGGSSSVDTVEPDSLIDQIKKEMTSEEKRKLYSAIGYEENAVPTIFPKSFVENRFEFELVRLQILLHDSMDASSSIILLASLDDVKATIEMRPVANAIMASVKVRDFSIDGTPQRCEVPSIVRPLKDKKEILDVTYETNPLDDSCDQRLHVSAEPLVVLYDANTIRRVISMFESTETPKIAQLQAAARQKLEALKKKSSLGLEYAIQNHAVIDVAINIKGSYLLVPYGGCSENYQRKILCNMGSLQIKSLDIRKPSELPNVRQMARIGSTEEDILQEMFSRSYDKFSIGLSDVQIISVLPEEDWSELIRNQKHDMFILKPMNLTFIVEKCLILNDPRLPKLKISGQLPTIEIDVTDTRLINAAAVLRSFPSAVEEGATEELAKVAEKEIELAITSNGNQDFEHLEEVFNAQGKRADEAHILQSFAEQATDLLVRFEFHKVRIHLSITKERNAILPVASFTMEGLRAEFTQKTLGRVVDLKLKDICMEYIDYVERQARSNTIITSRGNPKELLSMRYSDAEMSSFNPADLKQAILKKLEVDFASLSVTFHQEATIDLLQISSNIQTRIDAIAEKTEVRCISTQETDIEIYPAKLLAREGKRNGKEASFEGVLFQLQARFNNFQLNMETRSKRLSEITVGGLDVTADVLVSHTMFRTELGKFTVVDPSENTLYREIATVAEGQAFQLEVVIHNEATANENVADMNKADLQVKLKMSRLKAVFLNSYVQELLLFINHFQEAKQAVIDASSAAASAAKENMQKVYVQATRVQLNIQFQAPYIIVPQASNSTDALIVDLGRMSLRNEFKKRECTNEIGSPAIVDSISLNLKDLSISLASLEGAEVKSTRSLMDPISFSLGLTRNLTSTWYFGEPDLKVDARMGQINVTLSQLAYIRVMQIMLQNLGEGTVESQQLEDPEKPTSTQNATIQQVSAGGTVASSQSPDLSPNSLLQIYGPPRVTVAFNIVLTEIKIELFSNALPKREMTFTPTLEKPLSRMAIQGFNLSGHMMSDLSIQSKVSLQALLLEDTRPLVQSSSSYSSPSIPGTPVGAPKRLVERAVSKLLYPTSQSANLPIDQMLFVDFEREKDKDSIIELHLTGFTLILCPSYLLRLLEFFTSAMPDSKEPARSKSAKHNANIEETIVKQQTKAQQNVALTTILVRIDKPDIFLVERLDSLDTNALVLNFEMMATILMLPGVKDISGQVKELHLYSCPFDRSQHEAAIASILKPTILEVKAKLCDDAEGAAQININLGNITLNVSPGTIALLTSVSKSMSFADGGTRDDSESEDTETLALWDDLWKAKPLGCFNLPFLDAEVGVEAHERPVEENVKEKKPQEYLMISCNSFELFIETGQGNRTAPLILLESNVTATVKNWSHSLDVTASLTLQAGYYNSKLALWEPLVEPVDCTRLGIGRRRPWEMVVSVTEKHEDLEAFEGLDNAAKKLEVKFESADNLEITITKSFLDVVSTLTQGFSDAVNQKLSVRDKPAAHYLVRNQLDRTLVLDIVASDFLPEDTSLADTNELIIEPDAKIALKLKPKARANSLLNEFDHDAERVIHVKFPELSYERAIPVSRSSLRYLAAGNKYAKEENFGVIAEISNDFGFRSITLRSIVQVRNHFHIPIDVYFMTKSGNEVSKIGQIEACGVLNVPPFALYTPTGELFFAPLGFLSTEAFVWRDLQRQKQLTKVLQCTSRKSPNDDPFYLRINGHIEHVLFEDTKRKTIHSFCYAIHLRPTVILHNSLPIPLYLLTCGTTEEIAVKPGESSALPTVEPGVSCVVFKLKNYMARDWACKEDIKPNPHELAVWSFLSYDGSSKASLDLGVFSASKDSTLHLSVYCPFWMVNNTGLLLTYKHSGKSSKKTKVHKSLKRWASTISLDSVASLATALAEDDNWMYHSENTHDPVLFSYRPKSFFGKKSAVLRVEDSEWSDKFSLDAAGSSGLVTCKSKNGACYQLGVTVQLSSEGLTKQVIFTPYHILSNLADYDVEVCEVFESSKSSAPSDRRKWILIPARQSVPFWPQGSQKSMIFRVAYTQEETLPLSWENPRRTLLRLDNRFGGIDVDFQVSESSIVFVCNQYEDGKAPLLLINQTDTPLTFSESNDTALTTELSAHHACYYTWKKPNGSRNLSWDSGIGKKSFPTHDIMRSGSGSFDSSCGLLQWVSFLQGRQRVLLFTKEETFPLQCMECNGQSSVEQNVHVLLHGLGVSLVDNLNRREILYAGITSSGIVWETAKKRRSRHIYRPVNLRENGILEEAYQQYLRKLVTSGNAESTRNLAEGWIVDFENMTASKPKERLIRRTYKYGCEFSYMNYGSRRLFHLSLYKIQIDNQLDDCVFPVILAPVPPPRSVATESIPHPFVEISIVELLNQQSDISQYDYFKLLIQECHVRIDMSLVNAIGNLFVTESDLKSEIEHKQNVEIDLNSARQGLHERTRLLNEKSPENYFRTLHLSPLKIHLSFSNTGSGGAIGSPQANNNPATQLLNLLVQSVGVSITEVQDVVFRLGYFERNDTFLSWQQLARDLQWHYTGQAVKQFYVLVFGLDVIGNPFGLALGISQGVEQLFYEPFQGAIQGPGEFVEGLTLGARSLLSNTIGGMAGAASRITGTIGKGLSFLTFDEEYQKSRRETLLRRPTDFGENLAQGGKGLLMGVVEGVSGVVMRPIEGAQQHGVGGFFTGIGKGVVGLVTRPTAAMADFASGSLDAMKKAADVNDEMVRLRPPRHLQSDGIVRPYVRYLADGDSLLKLLDKGRFAKTDHYIDHVGAVKGVLLVTDRRIILMNQDLFSQWQVEWAHTWEELAAPPVINPNGLYIPLKVNKKVFGMFTSNESGKLLNIHDAAEKCEVIVKKVEALMKA